MEEPSRTLTVTRAALIGSLIALAVAATCVRLGFWQLSRLEQRDARNRLLGQRMGQPVLRLGPNAVDTTRLFYRRVEVNGRYDHDRTIILAGRALRGAPGVHVLTPVLIQDGQTAVLVNRGWLPSADGATVELDSLRTPSDARLIGLLLPLPARRTNATMAADSTFRRTWFSIDPDALRRQFPYTLLEFHIQALPEKGVAQFPVRLSPPELDRGPHLGYAIQWFSFAVIALVGWLTLMIRKGEVQQTQHPARRV
ncbi:MAG: SURF1 family protein [Longimicrobiales bacterium]